MLAWQIVKDHIARLRLGPGMDRPVQQDHDQKCGQKPAQKLTNSAQIDTRSLKLRLPVSPDTARMVKTMAVARADNSVSSWQGCGTSVLGRV